MTDRRGWFAIPGIQDGERTVKQQIKGLGPLTAEVVGKTVLDLGCAEGLIMKYLIDRGAESADGVEIVPERVELGTKLLADYRVRFFVADLEHLDVALGEGRLPLRDAYDAVLALSIAHKFARPVRFIATAARLAKRFLAIRLPSPIINDPRSGYSSVDVRRLVQAEFDFVSGEPAGLNEVIMIFRRRPVPR